MPIKVEITVLSGVSAGDVFRFNLEPAGKISIGRQPENALVLQDPTVSRNHAEILLRSDGLYLADLGSSQGTVHMGFQLHKGGENARRLRDGDEFKIGSAIFRVQYPEDEFEPESSVEPGSAPGGRASARFKFRRLSKKQKLYGAVGLAGVAAIFFLLPGEQSSSGGPRTVAPIPLFDLKEEIINGTRADKLKFLIPSADLVIDYDLKSETPIHVYLDEAKLITVEPSPSWDHKQIVVRDLLLGRQRGLIFDSPDIPRTPGSSGPYKKWGVRNIRLTAIKRDPNVGVTDRLRAAFAAAEGIESSPTGLAVAIQSFHEALLALVDELQIDGIAYDIQLETMLPERVEFSELIERIARERTESDITVEMSNRHLNVIAGTTARLEAELWRRTTSRLNAAKLASDAENYIDAYDRLIEIMAMFEDQRDLRFIFADRDFRDTSIIPKQVRLSPNKYRKRKDYSE